MKDKPRDSFVSFTYTRASSCSLKRRLNRLSADLTAAHKPPQQASNKSKRPEHASYITELCLDFTRSDIICYLPALTEAVQVIIRTAEH